MPTYLFYDIETTGLNKCFDQIVQFAAIRTDLNFRELEQHEFQIRLNSDIIPAPDALITHRLGWKDLQKGEKEIDALLKIHRLFNTPGTISLGYNTLGFDDEFLRFSFYRSLLPPYMHQYANDCARMDIYPITLLYYLFQPNQIKWPLVDGRPSLKLANLISENNLVEGKAHNALVDVKATLALARLLAENSKMWEFALGYFNKEKDLARLNRLKGEALLIQGKIGSRDQYMAPVLSLGQHYHYKNQTLWLRLDQSELSQLTIHNPEKAYVFRKKLSESPILLPPQERYLEKISEDRLALSRQNKKWLEEHPEILSALQDYHRQFVYPSIPKLDIDAALYEIGFPSREEEVLFSQFHQTEPKNKEKIAEKFPHKKRQIQAYRILGRFYPEYLSDAGLAIFQASQIQEDALDYRGQAKLSPKMAEERITALLHSTSLDPEQIQILLDFQSQLHAWALNPSQRFPLKRESLQKAGGS